MEVAQVWYALAAIAAVIVLIAAFAALVPVRVIVSFVKNSAQGSAEVTVKIAFLRLKIFPNEKKPSQKSKSGPQQPEEKKSVTGQIRAALGIYNGNSSDIHALLDYISRNAVKLEKIRLNMIYGTDDAAQTGILYGVISGAVYGFFGALCNRAESALPEVTIVPVFDTSRFEADGECIARLKNVHIIVIAVKLCKLYLKIRKGK